MKKWILLFLIISISSTKFVYAESKNDQSNNEERSFEEFYLEIGYKSIEDALKECENHFQRELNLPIKLPAIPFTHHFGRFNDLEGKINDSFEVEYLNEMNGPAHYTINVRPIEHKINFHNKNTVIRTYNLKDDNKALYLTTPGNNGKAFANQFVFEKQGWQYILSVHKELEDKIPANVLVQIANSIYEKYPAQINPLDS